MFDKKVISLLPSATEIICALGLENQLVGRSFEGEFPDFVKRLPSCTFAAGTSSKNSKNANSPDLSAADEVDMHLLKTLQPDVIFTLAQGEESEDELRSAFEHSVQQWTGKNAEVVFLKADSLEAVKSNILLIAQKLGVTSRGEVLVEDLTERVEIIRHKLKFFADRPVVAFLQSLDPLVAAGPTVRELIKVAGGSPATGYEEERLLTPELLAQSDADVLIIGVPGWSVATTLQKISMLLQFPGWVELRAVKNDQVFIVDGTRYFRSGGPMMVDSLEILAEILRPDQFVFGFEGEAWLKFGVS